MLEDAFLGEAEVGEHGVALLVEDDVILDVDIGEKVPGLRSLKMMSRLWRSSRARMSWQR